MSHADRGRDARDPEDHDPSVRDYADTFHIVRQNDAMST